MVDGADTVLVLGATGGIGGELARQLHAHGWHVRALTRDMSGLTQSVERITWVRGDAMNRDDVVHAAEGCSVIVHAVNPPGYRDWEKLVIPMLDNTIAAASARRSTIVLPGTVYNFGPDAFPILREDSPQHPTTRKGAIRVQMERRLESASREGTPVIIVRAGDFFGPKAGNNWLSQGLVKPNRPVRTISNPAAAGVGHQWGYIPDVARTMVELLGRRDALSMFERFHMAGHWDPNGKEMVETIQLVMTRRTGRVPGIAGMPWWTMRLIAPFDATVRELMEMRYLWQQPVRMVNDRLIQVLGHEPHTPLEQAVEATLIGVGCLSAKASPSPQPDPS